MRLPARLMLWFLRPSKRKFITAWRKILVDEEKSWVLFRNGTCVVLSDGPPNLVSSAMALLREHGPVVPGTERADFSVIQLHDVPGWVVKSHRAEMMTYVTPREFPRNIRPNPPDVAIGLVGRIKRDMDARSLKVIHVESGHMSK